MKLFFVLFLFLKGKFKNETESFLIAAQNNAIRTNYIKEKTDNTQKNSKCKLYVDRYKRVNYIISKCNVIAGNDLKLDMTGWEQRSLRIMQEIEIWLNKQMVHAKTKIRRIKSVP